MSLKSILARLVAFFNNSNVGETLAILSKEAEADYDRAINQAHSVLREAKAEIGSVAVVELERLETLIEAAKRRALALEQANVLPDAHGARLDAVVEKVA